MPQISTRKSPETGPAHFRPLPTGLETKHYIAHGQPSRPGRLGPNLSQRPSLRHWVRLQATSQANTLRRPWFPCPVPLHQNGRVTAAGLLVDLRLAFLVQLAHQQRLASVAAIDRPRQSPRSIATYPDPSPGGVIFLAAVGCRRRPGLSFESVGQGITSRRAHNGLLLRARRAAEVLVRVCRLHLPAPPFSPGSFPKPSQGRGRGLGSQETRPNIC